MKHSMQSHCELVMHYSTTSLSKLVGAVEGLKQRVHVAGCPLVLESHKSGVLS